MGYNGFVSCGFAVGGVWTLTATYSHKFMCVTHSIRRPDVDSTDEGSGNTAHAVDPCKRNACAPIISSLQINRRSSSTIIIYKGGERVKLQKIQSMKKIIAASGVAFLALAAVASAQSYQFSTNLTVGSTGSDVSALQTWLIANGFSIPSVASGAASKGYFGSQTKSAVAKYQASVGLPSTGFVGPLTRTKLNGGAAVVTTTVSTNCPAGFTCTPATGTTPVVGTVGGISTPGVAGTLAVSLWTTPSGVTAYKGQSYDIAGYKLQASASDMSVTNLSFDFDTRFWLYASALTVKDQTGAVVGSISNLNALNFTELTVGSDYRVNVPVTNLVVKATQAKYLTLNATFLGVTDRSSGPINVIQAQVRAVDGTGVTDTETVNASNSGVRQFTFQGTNIGQLVLTTDSSAPVTQTVQVSTSAQTQNVPLAIYDIKSSNQPGTLQALTIGLNISSSTLPVGNLFANIQLKAAGLTYSASSISTTSATFTNLAIPLAADTYLPLTISATLAADTNNIYDNVSVSTTLNTTSQVNGVPVNVTVVDPTYNNVQSNAVALTSNAQTFSASGVTSSGLSVVAANAVANTGASTTQQITFSYSLTAGNNPIYVNKNFASSTVTSIVTSGINVQWISYRDNDSTNDGAGYFYIAPGQTKTFTAVLSASGLPGRAGTVSITGLNYGTGTSGLGGSLQASNIGNTLFATISF